MTLLDTGLRVSELAQLTMADLDLERLRIRVLHAKGNKQRVPATQHRFVARAEAQVELSGKTRTLRASEEVRDVTWEAAPKLAVAAKFDPSVPPPDELKKHAALAFLRTLARALAALE